MRCGAAAATAGSPACAAGARATAIESWVWRLAFALLLVFGGVGLLLYILLWLFVPSD